MSGHSVVPCPTTPLPEASSTAIVQSTLTTTTTAVYTSISTIPSVTTTTSTITYTSTTTPTLIVPQVKVPLPSYVTGSVKLWKSLPRREDLAVAPSDAQELSNWKEIAAICDALINSAPWFLPEAVFGVPSKSYTEDTAMASPGAPMPLARVDDQSPNKAIVPLNLFTLSEKPLSVNVSFGLSENMDHVVWQRAISAAFLHPEVQKRLESIRKSYIGPFLTDTDPKGNKFKAMAIFEMLTGLSADVMEQPCAQNGNTCDKDSTPMFEKLGKAEDDLMWTWFFKDFTEMARDGTLKYPPTVLFSSDQKLRSVTIPDSKDLFIFNLEDPANPDADKDAQGIPIEYSLKQVAGLLVWAVRQKDLSLPLNSTSTQEIIRQKALTHDAYYQNGPWDPLPALKV